MTSANSMHTVRTVKNTPATEIKYVQSDTFDTKTAAHVMTAVTEQAMEVAPIIQRTFVYEPTVVREERIANPHKLKVPEPITIKQPVQVNVQPVIEYRQVGPVIVGELPKPVLPPVPEPVNLPVQRFSPVLAPAQKPLPPPPAPQQVAPATTVRPAVPAPAPQERVVAQPQPAPQSQDQSHIIDALLKALLQQRQAPQPVVVQQPQFVPQPQYVPQPIPPRPQPVAQPAPQQQVQPAPQQIQLQPEFVPRPQPQPVFQERRTYASSQPVPPPPPRQQIQQPPQVVYVPQPTPAPADNRQLSELLATFKQIDNRLSQLESRTSTQLQAQQPERQVQSQPELQATAEAIPQQQVAQPVQVVREPVYVTVPAESYTLARPRAVDIIRRPVVREYGPVRSYVRPMPVDHTRHVEYVKEQQLVYEHVDELEYEYLDEYELLSTDPYNAPDQATAATRYSPAGHADHNNSHPTAHTNDRDYLRDDAPLNRRPF